MKFWKDGFGMFVCRCGANWGGLWEDADWQEVFLPFDTLHFLGEFVEFFVELGKQHMFQDLLCIVLRLNARCHLYLLTANYT